VAPGYETDMDISSFSFTIKAGYVRLAAKSEMRGILCERV